MYSALRLMTLTSLLAASAIFSQASGNDFVDANVTECLPEIPPLIDANGTMVALQMHQWIWVENLTSPDWAPRTVDGVLHYEFLRPGFVMSQTLRFMSTLSPVEYVNVSYVTNGDTLCAAALTQSMNRSSGAILRSYTCNRVCHDNFTSLGTRLNLPLMVQDNWIVGSRYNEYLAFDAVDPDSRAVYKCLGTLDGRPMARLPSLLDKEVTCPAGDECMFNYNDILDEVGAGCKSTFFELKWCVSDMDLCSYNIDGDCPVCCRGDLCNGNVARTAYQRWQTRMASTTQRSRPTTTVKGAEPVGASLWLLGAGALGVISLLQARWC